MTQIFWSNGYFGHLTDSTHIWNNPYNGMVRLTGGNYVNEGLIEVYCNGR